MHLLVHWTAADASRDILGSIRNHKEDIGEIWMVVELLGRAVKTEGAGWESEAISAARTTVQVQAILAATSAATDGALMQSKRQPKRPRYSENRDEQQPDQWALVVGA